MSLDPAVPLAQLAALVASISGIQHTYVGWPVAFDKQLCAVVLLDAADPLPTAPTETIWLQIRFQVIFAYRVQDAEATAESTLATAAGAFWQAFYSHRTLSTTWTQSNPSPQPSLPSYLTIAGQEMRLMPLAVQGVVDGTFSVNQP